MVISQPPGNNPSYYYRASPTLPQLLWMLPEHLMFYTIQYNIRVTHKMVLLSIFFTRIRSTEGSSADCSLFILSLHALALHLAVKILLLQIFLYEDLSTLALHTLCPCSLQNANRTALCYAIMPIERVKNIPNIWHKSSTKHKEVEPDWNDKAIMQTTRPRITWKVLPMAQVAIFKGNIRSSAKRFRHNVVLFWTKTSQRLIIFAYLATDNIHIVLENDNTVLIKGLKKVVNVKFSKHASYRNVLW